MPESVSPAAILEDHVEQVMAFAAAKVAVFPQGYSDYQYHLDHMHPSHLQILDGKDWVALKRKTADGNPVFKQPIPYIVLSRARNCGDGEVEVEIFTYCRSTKGGEDRLHRKLSIGIGGHLNPEDMNDARPCYIAGLIRELLEEVMLPTEDVNWQQLLTPRGILNDDSNPVGRVHFGIVHVLMMPWDSEVYALDGHLEDARWYSVSELIASRDRLENWSLLAAIGLGLLGTST